MASESNTLRKYVQPLVILAIIVLVIWLAIVSMAVLIPFLVGILLAYLLMPLVKLLERVLPFRGRMQKAKRIISVVIVFIAALAVLVLFTIYVGAALVAASQVLINRAPEFIEKSMGQVNEWIRIFKLGLPGSFINQFESMVAGLGPAVGKFIQDFLVGSMAVIPASAPTIMGFVTLPFFLFFILMDYESFQDYFRNLVPTSAAAHLGRVLGIIGDVMGRYIRAQIILGAIVGFMVFIGLWVLQVDYAPALGAVTAVTQFIPIVGPVISGLIILIITLALQPAKVLWALLVVVLAQLILNTVLLNWIQGKFMQLHPAVVMVLLVVGGYVAGFWGMILAVPVAATIWEIFKYFRSLQKEQKLQA